MTRLAEDRKKAKELRKSGISVKEAAKTLKKSPTFIKKWSKMDAIPKKLGRPSIITPAIGKKIKNYIYEKENMSPRRVSERLGSKGVNVSRRTISNFTKSQGWKAYKRRKKPLMSKKNIEDRLRFARNHQHLKFKDWERWLFTDEASVKLYGQPNKQNDRFYTDHSERVPPVAVPKYNPSIMVWGGMTARGLTELHLVEKKKTVDSFYYVDKILEPAIQKIKSRNNRKKIDLCSTPLFPNATNWTFQQDGATAHTAKISQEFLKKKVPHFIESKDWPGNSPDLNPIENLWFTLKEKIMVRNPKNEKDLWRITQEEWKNLGPKILSSLISSMPTRIKAVLEAKGGHTKY